MTMNVKTRVVAQRELELTRAEMADHLFGKRYTVAQIRKMKRRATWIRGACAVGIIVGVCFGLWAVIANSLE